MNSIRKLINLTISNVQMLIISKSILETTVINK